MYLILQVQPNKVKTLPDSVIQNYLDHYSLYSKSFWLLLLEEKLRRVELEIAIV